MTDVQHTVLDTNNGLGSSALGAGFGGLIGSWFGQGMNGNGWGGGNNNTYLANQLSAIQSQAVTNGVANQQAVSNASQYVTEAVNSNGRDTTQAINNGTIANVQGQGDTKLTIAGLGANPKIYIYVVEGIKQPKNEKEVPCSIMYVWFSTVNNMAFNPNMISASEWLMANVYAGNLTDTRISKLAYLTENIVKKEQNIQRPALIKLDETTKTKSKKE